MDPFVYQYGVGSLIFAGGMLYAARQGYIGLRGDGLRNLVLMLLGLLFFMVLQGYLQYAPMSEAPQVAYDGAPSSVSPSGEPRRIGQPIDFAVMLVYLVVILLIGLGFGRGQRSTKDFFFGGQRFSWWLISLSLVATLVGSYSFVKYSDAAYRYGTASSQTYLNDWMWMPFLLFGWLPILYFSRVVSVPEYFGRRFNSKVRLWATVSVLIYLVSYIGVNLFTMGTVMHYLLGWDVLVASALIASVSAIYVTIGGQTSVIMTDLFQGVMLLVAGAIILVLGIHHLGGFESAWQHLPRGHRLAFNNFNENPSFPSVGIFWQDGVANSAFFYFLNQGILMRFMATKSTREARKAAVAMPLLLMPVAACVVASGGWVAKGLVHAGALPEMEPDQAFYVASEFLARPGVFGLILAALAAALMSTVDTLITAVATISVNDFYKPYIRPQATDAQMLRMARFSSVGVTLFGVALVPVFAAFDTIYAAHGAMTAAVTPPLVVALLLAVFWRRYTATAALWTIAGGLAAIAASVFWPQLVAPFAHDVPLREAGEGLFAGAKQYKFMRALFGIVVCLAIGVVVSLFTEPEPEAKQRGLVWGTIQDAIRYYKGSDGVERKPTSALAFACKATSEAPLVGEGLLPQVRVSASLAEELDCGAGDLCYISDSRWWLGGLRSTHAIVAEVVATLDSGASLELGPATFEGVVKPSRGSLAVRVERLY